MPTKKASIGRSIPRVDGASKVTGAARYVDDTPTMPGELYGLTVRSTVAHGILEAIDRDPAFDWSGVTLVTAADIPGKNFVALMEQDQPALVPVGGHVKHCDEPLALVAAPDHERAAAAARALRIRVKELPAVLDVETSRRAEIRLH